MQLTSTAFRDGETIPRRYTEDGENTSPPLAWSGVPPKTQELALIVDDPDAPQADPWVHWLIYNIPAGITALPEGIDRNPTTTGKLAGLHQGRNTWNQNNVGYRGPAPPKGHGTHHYHFKLYALDRSLNLAPLVQKGSLEAAMKKVQVLGTAELIGLYER